MLRDTELTIQTFAKLFIAKLVLEGRTSFRPHDEIDQRAAMELYNFVSNLADQYKPDDGNAKSRFFKDLIRIRNKVAPSFTGAFDNFESLLREQQHWLTSSRNPTYEAISFDLDPGVARQILFDSSEEFSDLIKNAANAYLGKQQAEAVDIATK